LTQQHSSLTAATSLNEPLHGHPDISRHIALALLEDETEPIVRLGVAAVRSLLVVL
jgi:hypothetical protein